jgi:CheY-like chemotaxis protein
METVHMLVVSDNTDDIEEIKSLLASQEGDRTHYHVESTHDYQDALKALVRNTHDVYLLDQKLPNVGGDSLDLLRRAIAGGCQRPAIILTLMADEDIDMAVEDVGAAGFLNRHFDMHERVIKHAIWHAVRHFQQLQDIRQQLSVVQKQLVDVGRKLSRGL